MTPKPEFRFADDPEKNSRMNRVLETIGNYPDGIGFNKLAELVKADTSRATLEIWLDIFHNYAMVESNTVRRGQKKVIKTNDRYKKWLEVQESYWMEVGTIKRKIAELGKFSHKNKFDAIKFFEIYSLQTQMTALPFSSYIEGLKYSMDVARLLRDSISRVLEPLYVKLSNILNEQKESYEINYQEIFTDLNVIMFSSPYLLLSKNNRKAKSRYWSLERSVKFALQKLENI